MSRPIYNVPTVPEAEEPLLSATEAAKMLGIHSRSLRRWVETGRIRAVKFPSGRYYFRPADIRAVLRGDAA